MTKKGKKRPIISQKFSPVSVYLRKRNNNKENGKKTKKKPIKKK